MKTMKKKNKNKRVKSNSIEFCVIDITRIWSSVSSYAIQEDVPKYLKELDKVLKDIKPESVVYITGKSPVWLYMIFVCYIITKVDGVKVLYSKPTVHGNRQYRIYPVSSI